MARDVWPHIQDCSKDGERVDGVLFALAIFDWQSMLYIENQTIPLRRGAFHSEPLNPHIHRYSNKKALLSSFQMAKHTHNS
jgi:hypothetical protein